MVQDEYKTITEKIGEGFYSEKRSKFLSFAHHVNTVEEVKSIIARYREKYYDARHCCYAYMLGPERQDFRANDDGEPSSTAGKPILGQINSNELTDILICVIRYYGGVNLGTSRLHQAYKTAAADAIAHSEIVCRLVEKQLTFHFTYPSVNAVMRVARDMKARVIEQNFDMSCTITLSIRESLADELQRRMEKAITGI